MGIQINGTTNNINAGIGSLSIEDIRELDITGVATASNFKTGISNLHDVGLTLTGGQIDVGSNIKIGTAGVITSTSFVGSGANLTNLNGSNIASGTIPTARLGSGTASSSTFLRGDSTFAAPPAGAISAIGSDGAARVLTSDGDGTATAHSFVTIESNRLSVNRGSGSGAYPLIVRRTDASGIIAEFANSSGYGLLIGQNSATGEAYLRTGTGQPLVFTTNSGSGIANERLRITSDGKLTLNYAATPSNEDFMICTAGQGSPARLSLSHLSGGNRYGARLQSISGTNRGLVISELFNSSYSDLAKVNTEFGLKADNTCKTWLCYRSEAGNEGIIDDFNVATVNDEGTGTFYVNLDRNIHRHGNGWSQSIVFGCYNDGSRQLVAGVGYAPSHGSNNPWWDVEDNGCRVQTQRSTDGTVVDAKVFNMAMFGDTGDLNPT